MIRPALGLPLLIAILVSATAQAAVTRVEIAVREPYAEGRSFENVGPYERWRGTVHFAVDPASPANQRIVDVELAPRNRQGLVEFSADLEVLAPADLSKANGAILYDVNNRGNKVALGQFNSGADEFLMRRGYIVVWSGWIAETAPGAGRLRLTAPVAMSDGKPLQGLVRAEVVVDSPQERWNLAYWANQGSYPMAPGTEDEAVLTWRLREKDARVVIPREQWRIEHPSPSTDGEGQLPLLSLVVSGGLKPGYIYELVYTGQGSIVQGVGLAGIRDLVSYFKYESAAHNPLTLNASTGSQNVVRYAYGFGVSQSGRCLRQFLYDGFNADESGRKVFDGVMPHVAGAGLGFFNHRFASPTRHNSQHDNHLYPADVFPFTYGDEQDPFTGRTDGILKRARDTDTAPKVMHTQSSSEYWHRSGSLVHTDPLGQRDAEIPSEVRIYAFGGTQHGAGSGQPATSPGNGQLIGNPADYRPFMRGLLTALDQWVREGKEPPPSVYPRIGDGNLSGWRQQESDWKPLPGVRYPEVIQQPEFLYRGPDFLTRRQTTIEPPESRGNYQVKIPRYGEDNRERGTLDLPSISVPIATYISWNLRSPAIGADTELLSLSGAYIPLPSTRDQGQTNGDPRRSIAELYRDGADYEKKFMSAAESLVQQRYVLPEELPRLVEYVKKQRMELEAKSF